MTTRLHENETGAKLTFQQVHKKPSEHGCHANVAIAAANAAIVN